MLDICLLGTGGTWPLPERYLTSLYVRHEGRALLIDCGEATQMAIRQQGQRFKAIDSILMTHFHADHISGLPGLLLTMGNESRTQPVNMYGPRGLEKVVNSLRAIVPELPFEIVFHELEMGESSFDVGGLNISAFPLDHGEVPCLGYGINLMRQGKFDAHKARQLGIPMDLWGRLQSGEHVEGFSPEDVLGAPRRGIKLIYATDTRPVPAIYAHGREADLLILEGMFGDPEKQERALMSRHMMMQEAARIARDVCARELWLTHYSPANPDPALYAEDIRDIFPNAVISKDGMSTTLAFHKDK